MGEIQKIKPLVMSKTHFKETSDSPYLGAWDLVDYKDKNLTIDRVVSEMSEGLKENSKMNIAYFKDHHKPMILNATNAKTIKRIAKTPYIEDWGGVEITLYVKTGVKAFGDVHDALRIRSVTKKTKKIEIEPSNEKLWTRASKHKQDGATFESLNSKNYLITKENYEKL